MASTLHALVGPLLACASLACTSESPPQSRVPAQPHAKTLCDLFDTMPRVTFIEPALPAPPDVGAPRLTDVPDVERCIAALKVPQPAYEDRLDQGIEVTPIASPPLGANRIVLALKPWALHFELERFVAAFDKGGGQREKPESFSALLTRLEYQGGAVHIGCDIPAWGLEDAAAEVVRSGAFELHRAADGLVQHTLLERRATFPCGPNCSSNRSTFHAPDCEPLLAVDNTAFQPPTSHTPRPVQTQ